MRKGILISVEGIDGSGKSSLVEAVAQRLEQETIDLLITKEPGGTELGKSLRTILHKEKDAVCDTAEYLLFAADRAQHFERVIIPALQTGKVVLSDRLADSSLAYQGFGRGIDIEMIQTINRWTMQTMTPDLIFYIKLDFQTALKRIMQRGGKLTSFETEQELFWKRVNDGFNTIFKDNPNVVTLDGTQTIDELADIATKEIRARL